MVEEEGGEANCSKNMAYCSKRKVGRPTSAPSPLKVIEHEFVRRKKEEQPPPIFLNKV